MRDRDANVRWHAVDALSKLKGPRVVQIFFAALEDADAGVRWRAASALGRTGRGYPAVVDALLWSLNDGDANVRAYAAEALGKLEDGRSLPALRELMKDWEEARFLGKIADIAWVAVHRLERRSRRATL
jgi:HEAT repeat protein